MDARQTLLAKRLLLAACFVPLLLLAARLAAGTLGGNPVRTAILYAGDWTMRFLILSLAVRPLSDVARRMDLLHFRRQLGLVALFYAALHFGMYLGLDYLFYLRVVLQEARRSPYIIVGFGSFLLLVFLGATSVKSWMRRLGAKRWSRMHRLVYPVAVGGVVHYALKAKTAGPELLSYAALVAALLVYRLMRKPLGLSGRGLPSPRF
jgi:sulfoxide reductase heme-binding subunit YedZ